jgi:hypothetical protein
MFNVRGRKQTTTTSTSTAAVAMVEKDPVTERADSLSMSGSPPSLASSHFKVVEEQQQQQKQREKEMEKLKQKLHLLKQELRAKDDMLEAVQSQAKLDIVNARTRVDSIEEKREELEARCAKAEKLALERTNALETANKKLKEAERSAKVFMQRANAKISEALRENSAGRNNAEANENDGPSPSSSSGKVERKMTPSNLSLQEKILRIERQQQMEDEEGLKLKKKTILKNDKEESSSSLGAVNNDDEDDEEEEKEDEKKKVENNDERIVETLRGEIQELLRRNADAARSFQNSLEIERNKRREAEERAEISEATCVRLQSELKSKEALLKMMESRPPAPVALQTRTLNNDESSGAQQTEKKQHHVGKFDAEESDDDEIIPSFSSPVLKSPPPLVSRK